MFTQTINVWKLFLGQLPKNNTEEDLKQLFEPYGKVLKTFVMRDPTTGASKGLLELLINYNV
jgi:RNA recognition motif-containing protein